MWTKVNRIIDRCQRFLLTTHINPDGDGLGSELALAAYLKSLGKEATIINSHRTPPTYRFLDVEEEIRVYRSERDSDYICNSDVIFILDSGSLDRLGDLRESIGSSPALKVCIDHHVGPQDKFDLIVSDEDACSVGEMIYHLIKSREGQLSLRIAKSLYVSILTDTGSFRFSNTNPRAHRAAADLIAAGVRPQEIYQKVYEVGSAPWIRLLGRVLGEINFECEERIAWFKITQDILLSSGVSLEEAKDFVDFPRLVGKVEVILLFLETEDGKIKVSIRSKGRVAINNLAVRFGGGGHPFASGITLVDRQIEGVVEEIVGETKKLFPN